MHTSFEKALLRRGEAGDFGHPNAWKSGMAAGIRCFGGGGGAPQRDLYAETAGEIKAKVDFAPQVLAAEQKFDPSYTALNLKNTQDALFGTAGGPQTTTTQQTVPGGWYDVAGNMVSGDPNYYQPQQNQGGNQGGWGRGIGNPPTSRLTWRNPTTKDVSSTVNTPGQMGYLDMMQKAAPQMAAIDASNLSTQRSSDIADVARLGPLALAATQAADPRTAGLVEGMTDQASQDLALGGQLSPEQLRQMKNLGIGQASARGWGYNPGDLAKVAMNTGDYSQQLLNQRRQFAGQTVGLRSSVYGDQFNRVLNRNQASNPQSMMGQATGIGSTGFPSFSSTINANDVYSSNQNAAAANNAARANSINTMIGAGAGIGAAAIMAI